MASNVTLLALRTEIRERGEWDKDYYSDAELLRYINGSLASLYDQLADNDPSRFLSTGDISVLSGTESYALPATFYRLISVDVLDASAPSGYWPLERFEWRERFMLGRATTERDTQYSLRGGSIYFHPIPSWNNTVRLGFIPTAPALAADIDTWDSINLWTEWVILDVCAKCAMKQEDDVQPWFAQREDTRRRIFAQPEQDHARPKTVTDVYGGFSDRRRYRRGWRY